MSTLGCGVTLKTFQLFSSLPRTADNLGTPATKAMSVIEAITSAFPVPWEHRLTLLEGTLSRVGQDVVAKGMVSL